MYSFTASANSFRTASTSITPRCRSRRAATPASSRRRKWCRIPFDCDRLLVDAHLKIGEAALREAGLRGWVRPRGLATIVGIALALLNTPAALHAQAIPGALPESTKALAQGEWPAYAGTYAAARYSPLTQIDRTNAKNLHIAWRWKSPDMAIKQANPKV